MLTRSNVAAASALCILGWVLIFGLSADANDNESSGPALLVLYGKVGSAVQDPAIGEYALSIDDGARNWSCAIASGIQSPEAGSQIIAICSLQPGSLPTVIQIIYPWSQNVF